MSLNDFFSPSYILHQLSLDSKAELISKFVEKAYNTNLISNRQELEQALTVQEEKSPAGLENGIALLHLRTELTRKSFMMMATLKTPLDFKTHDKTPANIVVLLCSPPEEQSVYIQLLARISRVLLEEANRKAILSAIGPNALFQYINIHGNWDILHHQEQNFLLQISIFEPRFIKDITSCLIELGLFYAQIHETQPLMKYAAPYFNSALQANLTAIEKTQNSIMISCPVSDPKIINNLLTMLEKRNISFIQPGSGFVTLTPIHSFSGNLETKHFI